MNIKLTLILSDRTLKIASIIAAFLFLFSSSVIPVFAAISYSYDTNGNMSSDGTNCFSYNDANELSQVKNCGTGKLVATYLYDDQGNRISSKSYDTNGNLVKTTYTPTQGYETVKLASNSAIQNTAYYYVNNKLVARKNPDNSKSYVLSDNLNSTSVVTDQNGNVLENTSYYPFGAIRSGGTKSKQLYTGQRNDSETGLDYYNARYYNSHIARFTQPDTVVENIYNPQELNKYSYVLNNPLRYTDPSGHCVGPLAFLAPVCIAAGAAFTTPEIAIAGLLVGAFYLATHPQIISNAINAIGTLFSESSNNSSNSTTSSISQNSSTGPSDTGNSSPKTPNMNPFHGNDIRNTAITTGYILRDKITGAISKIGESMYPATRYTQQYLEENNVRMQRVATGTKEEMRIWEHENIGQYINDHGAAPILNSVYNTSSKVFNVLR